MESIHHLKDIGYTVVAKRFEYRVEFTCYTIISCSVFRNGAEVESIGWNRKDYSSSPDLVVDDVKDAQIFLHGEVKWDGCSNWFFDEQTDCMIHRCDRAGLENIGKLMAWCYDFAAPED